MRANRTIIALLLNISAGVSLLLAQTPTSVDYTGRVAVDGENFTSTEDTPGYFKCILMTGAGDTIWANDGVEDLSPAGSSANGGPPTGAIELKPDSPAAPFAVNGQFKLRLGGEYDPAANPPVPPNPIKAEILRTIDYKGEAQVRPDVRLRVWFSPDGSPGSYEKLTPDVHLGSVPFAIWAARAERVKDGGITSEQLRDGGIGSAFLNPGYDPDAMIEDPDNPGQFIPDPVRTDPEKALIVAGDQIHDGAVTSAKLADDGLIMSKIGPAFQHGRWSDLGPSQLTLDPDRSAWTAVVDFERAFALTPVIEADGWALGDAGKTGFTANTNAFAVRSVDRSGRHASLAVVDGRPAISYFHESTWSLKYAIADDARGTGWPSDNIVTVDDRSFRLGWGNSLAVVDGRPAISYWDDENGTLKYAISGDPRGETWPAANIVTVDDVVSPGDYTSLAVVDGRPAISYFCPFFRELRFAIAEDASGATWPAANIVWVDEGNLGAGHHVGRYPSLAVVDGRPAVSYWDVANQDLKYAIAGDEGGTSWPGTNIVMVDSVGDVGAYTSLAVVNGRPAISYADSTNDQLKYAWAGDISGGNWPTANIVAVESSGWSSSRSSLAVLNGKPALCYTSTEYGLRFAMAGDADGATWPAENIVTVATEGDTPSLAVVDGVPAISDAWGPVYATIQVPGGRWTARNPGQAASVVAVRAAGVVDGAVTGTSFAENLGVWSRSGDDVYRDSGRVGIGTASPAGELHVVGAAGNNTGVWSQFSDRRLKGNIAPLPFGSLERLLGLEGVSYDYNREDLRKGYEHRHRGWIAQEVEDVFPEWVSEAPDGMKMVTPVGFRARMVESLRELRIEKDAALAELETEGEILEREGAELRRRLGRLEELMNGPGRASGPDKMPQRRPPSQPGTQSESSLP